jgi:LytS/YehU family sensor histidine kinase
VRYVLDNSDKQVVSLEAELNSLRNYVELEMQQFESGFEFRIDCEEGIELSDYELPSLLLQPFVENSIKHGISKMKGKGKIVIDIRRKGENLLIAIEDNGIGFEEAKEWNIKNREPHESRGTKIIFQRIEAYNKLFKKNIKAEFRDLRSENGTLSGTRVEVEI